MAAIDQLWAGFTSGRPYGLVLLDAHGADPTAWAAARIRERSALAATRLVLLTRRTPRRRERFRECVPTLTFQSGWAELCYVVATRWRATTTRCGQRAAALEGRDDSEFTALSSSTCSPRPQLLMRTPARGLRRWASGASLLLLDGDA